VAFSNSRIYGGALTRFPAVVRDDCLRHVVVAQGPEPGQEVSVTAEVQKVVDLILEHARTRPAESLGVILSIGYGKHPDGRMRYQWGPLLRDGGARRLNVAATRARRRLTLVSSFSSHDVDPDRVTKAGARLLADYLGIGQRPGPGPAARRAPAAAGLGVPPALVD